MRHLTTGTLTARKKVDSDEGEAADKTDRRALEVSNWLRDHHSAFVSTLIAALRHTAVVYRVGR